MLIKSMTILCYCLQAGIVVPDVGFVALDIAFNCLKGPAKEGIYGNGEDSWKQILDGPLMPISGSAYSVWSCCQAG